MQSNFTGSLTEVLLTSCVEDKVFVEMMCDLNCYRLGFISYRLIRGTVWYNSKHGRVKILGEIGFKQYLCELIAKYKEKYKCNENDNKSFNQLLNYV